MFLIAIDPGMSGAIAACDTDGFDTPKGVQQTVAFNMPDTLADILTVLEDLGMRGKPDMVTMERVGTYMPGNSGPSAATFAEHVGALKGILTTLRFPFELVLPAKWQDAFVGKIPRPTLLPLPKLQKGDWEYKRVKKLRSEILRHHKQEKKRKIKEKSQQLFPHIKVTLLNADALGMLYVAMRGKG
jgi:hypothetical protein